jgi:hypothetical protein
VLPPGSRHSWRHHRAALPGFPPRLVVLFGHIGICRRYSSTRPRLSAGLHAHIRAGVTAEVAFSSPVAPVSRSARKSTGSLLTRVPSYAVPRADVPELRPGESRGLPLLRRMRDSARIRDRRTPRGAKGRDRPVLRPGRVDGTGREARPRGRACAPLPLPRARPDRAGALGRHGREVHRGALAAWAGSSRSSWAPCSFRQRSLWLRTTGRSLAGRTFLAESFTALTSLHRVHSAWSRKPHPRTSGSTRPRRVPALDAAIRSQLERPGIRPVLTSWRRPPAAARAPARARRTRGRAP